MLLVLLISLGSGLLSWFGPAQTSYTESYLVRAGDTSAASGGRLGYPNVHASGRLTVKSCCGLSTNDMMFAISNQDFGARLVERVQAVPVVAQDRCATRGRFEQPSGRAVAPSAHRTARQIERESAGGIEGEVLRLPDVPIACGAPSVSPWRIVMRSGSIPR